MKQDGARIGGEHDLAVADGVKERFNPEPVAGQQEFAGTMVPEREGEHAVEMRQDGERIISQGM